MLAKAQLMAYKCATEDQDQFARGIGHANMVRAKQCGGDIQRAMLSNSYNVAEMMGKR